MPRKKEAMAPAKAKLTLCRCNYSRRLTSWNRAQCHYQEDLRRQPYALETPVDTTDISNPDIPCEWRCAYHYLNFHHRPRHGERIKRRLISRWNDLVAIQVAKKRARYRLLVDANVASRDHSTTFKVGVFQPSINGG